MPARSADRGDDVGLRPAHLPVKRHLDAKYTDMDRMPMAMGAMIAPLDAVSPRGPGPIGRIVRAGVLCLLAVVGLAGTARAAEIAVVVNPALPAAALDRDALREIYLGERGDVDGAPVRPVDYRGRLPLRDGFLRATVGVTCRAFDSYWIKEVFRSGAAPPVRVDGVRDMLHTVANDPAAVGYVPVERLTGVSTVRTVMVLTVP